MEYIKRTAVFEQFDNADADVCETDDFGGVDYGFGMKNIKELINAIPAADVAPVVHGRWVTHYRSGTPVVEGYVSTCCDMWCAARVCNFVENYAKMDGGDNDACL